MLNVVSLDRIPPANTVLRRLACLSPDAMRFVLAVLAFRHLKGRTGTVPMSEIVARQKFSLKSEIIYELMEAGVIRQCDDGTVVCHPIIQEMMAPLPASPCDIQSGTNNVIAFSVNKRVTA